MWFNPGNLKKAHRHKNVEIVTEAPQFPEKEYINGFFVAVYGNKTNDIFGQKRKLKKETICDIRNIIKKPMFIQQVSNNEIKSFNPSLSFFCVSLHPEARTAIPEPYRLCEQLSSGPYRVSCLKLIYQDHTMCNSLSRTIWHA
jgi:hypothetical protein